VQKKFNVLLRYASAQFEKFMTKKKKKNESEDQQGYFDKLTLKVIDNLQLQVKNIHVRWESNNTYAWGLKLDSLDAYTTNYEWLKVFIDRTDEKNRLTPINKLVMLSRLCIYWNAAETVFLQETSVEAISSAAIEEVINITAEFKWS
jgi:vacuolar protein sorting-associated protein 13A/C